MSTKPPKEEKVPVSTWLSVAERDRMLEIAARHNVSAAAYIRAVLVDAIAEDMQGVPATGAEPKVG